MTATPVRPTQPIACDDARLTELLQFVEARYLEAVVRRARPRFAGHDEADLPMLTATLLDRVRQSSGPSLPSSLSGQEVRVLRDIAISHDAHPDFDYMWHYGV